MPRKKKTLRKGAVPSVFPNLPAHLSTSEVTPQQDPSRRRMEAVRRANAENENWLVSDQILRMADILNQPLKFNIRKWPSKSFDDHIFLYSLSFNRRASISYSIIITNDFKIQIYYNNTELDMKKFQWVLGKDLKCDRFSQIENLLSSLDNVGVVSLTTREIVTDIITKMKLLHNHVDCNKNGKLLEFLEQQLVLWVSSKNKYSTELLIFSSSMFFMFPAAYRFLRDSGLLVLPHPNYIKTFNVGSNHSGIMHKKCLEETVNLLLDEIYVKPEINYKRGKLEGFSMNKDSELATTVQTFMVTSVLSDKTDVVGIFSVKNLDSQYLFEIVKKVMNVLNDVGCEVLSITSGKLTKETYSALLNTTQAMVELVNYLLNTLKIKYVLLGKFQTDPLEKHFGVYRCMSGSNYHVSVQQILESKKKSLPVYLSFIRIVPAFLVLKIFSLP